MKPKDIPNQWRLLGAPGPSLTSVPLKTIFGFLVIVYDIVGDGDKFTSESFGLGRPLFHATSHLKTKVLFLFTVIPQGNSGIRYNRLRPF